MNIEVVLVLITIISGDTLAQDCWWSGCQPDSWDEYEKGCFPDNEFREIGSEPCDSYEGPGHEYHCCPTSGGGDDGENEIAANETGECSWYGAEGEIPQGNPTASGEGFDRFAMRAAHRWLEFGTNIRVTDLENGNTVDVTINDRGPFVDGRILDLTYGAFGVVDDRDKGVIDCSYDIL